MDLSRLAANLIASNPQIAKNPNAQSMIGIIQANDAQKGEAIARNLCASMGISEQEAINQAKRFFGI